MWGGDGERRAWKARKVRKMRIHLERLNLLGAGQNGKVERFVNENAGVETCSLRVIERGEDNSGLPKTRQIEKRERPRAESEWIGQQHMRERERGEVKLSR